MQLPKKQNFKHEQDSADQTETTLKLKIEKITDGSEKKTEISEKVVSLNTGLKSGNTQFKKRTINQQSSRQRNDD